MKKIIALIRKKLQNQLIAIFVSISVILTIILISFSYHFFSKTLQNNYIDSSSMSLKQLETYVSSYFDKIDNLTLQLYSDVMLSPEHYISKDDNYESYTYILKELLNIYLQSKDIYSTCFYLPELEELFIVDRYSNYSTYVASSFLATDIFQQIVNSNNMLIIPQHLRNSFPDELQSDTKENIITIARSIKFNNQVVAFLFINYNTDSLCQILAENTDTHSLILLCDLYGNYIASSSYNVITLNHSILQKADSKHGQFKMETGNDTQFYLYQKMEYPLMLVKTIPMHAILQQAHSMRTTLCILAFIFIIVVVIIIIRISFYMTSRIVSLKKCINIVSDGNFNIHPEIKGEDEITDISIAFYNMSQKIQYLIQEKYTVELASQRATLNALNAQINPHFLYNTLQTISSIAHEENVPDIEIMMKALSNMMRYAIKPIENIDEQETTISRELQNCEDYLKLLYYRYTDRLLYNIKMDSHAADILIPRLSLQPLIENSILHGMGDNISPCILLINAYVQDNICIISISDNGQGISEAELSLIRQTFTKSEPSSHLGLQNVYTRFKIMYASSFKFDINSIPNKKTSVQISILDPKRKEIK